ncbi:hypothetical protein D3C86_1301580 [compost metagenome]
MVLKFIVIPVNPVVFSAYVQYPLLEVQPLAKKPFTQEVVAVVVCVQLTVLLMSVAEAVRAEVSIMNAAPAITFSLDRRVPIVRVSAVFFEDTEGDFAINPVFEFIILGNVLGIAKIDYICYVLVNIR